MSTCEAISDTGFRCKRTTNGKCCPVHERVLRNRPQMIESTTKQRQTQHAENKRRAGEAREQIAAPIERRTVTSIELADLDVAKATARKRRFAAVQAAENERMASVYLDGAQS